MHMIEIPPVDLLLAGCGTLLVFAFAFAALCFDGWRRATRRQSLSLATQSQTLTQQLSALDARVNATETAIRRLDERIERQKQPDTIAPSASARRNPRYSLRVPISTAPTAEPARKIIP